MARMIPSVISPDVKSNAERKVFEWFRTAKGTENWIVLHSLGIASHNTSIYGEIDFLVLAPGKGLFVIEVKGGRVGRREGVWSFTDRYGNTSTKRRGPFEQANEASYSIVAAIKAQLHPDYSYLNSMLFGSGVIFPDIVYEVEGFDHEPWQVYDLRDGADVTSFISRLSIKTAEKIEAKYGKEIPFKSFLGVKEVEYISGLLRGDFDRPVPLSTHIKTAGEQRINLTKEQYRLVDQLEDNPRCLIQGGAGTGKTLIAIQESMRAVAEERKTAFICFNNNLGQWLKNSFPDPSLKPDFVGTFHSFLLHVLKREGRNLPIPIDEKERHQFFSEILPYLTLQRLEENSDSFDLLIIDEAQDLVNDLYLKVFDSMLTKGLARGRWRMFGDFSMQAIFSQSMKSEEIFKLLEDRTSFINFKLTINCRNPQPICEEIKTVTGYAPQHETVMKIGGPPVNYVTYKDNKEGAEYLELEIGHLLNQGVKPGQITILSLLKREDSLVDLVKEYLITDFKPAGNSNISFSTIQSFKGLENQIIMVTDIASYGNEQLLYIAYSRAVTALYVFTRESADKEYRDLQKRRFIR